MLNDMRLQTALERKCLQVALPATSVAIWKVDRHAVLEGIAPKSLRR